MHNFVFYSSYLVLPFLFFLLFLLYKKRKNLLKNKISSIILILLLILSLLFIYARFIERNLIFVKTTEINVGFSAKLVIISDMHLGVYKDVNFLERVVSKINEIENIDAVLIPGDFTYYPPENLDKLFTPLKNIKVPIYAVLGNHDSEKPGPPIQKKLQQVLEDNGVMFLHNTDSIIKNKNIKIIGLGDRWANEDDISIIDNFSKDDNLIILTHNPDTTLRYGNSIPDLTIAGHTHGGQIRIPFVYKDVIPCIYNFDQGLYDLIPQHVTVQSTENIIFTENNYGKVFVTAGIGEIGLPMRLGIPPTIEILELK
ncbi:MAG: metallophosphoesterase [Patescibacteria group bacterium]|nr:metallophosphoesterase [Patescibacteria group bacterium]